MPPALPDDPAWTAAYVAAVSGWNEDADHVLHPISRDDAAALWLQILKHSTWPNDRAREIEGVRQALHESTAAECEAQKQWFAAAFHLRWLLKRGPGKDDWKRRLAVAEKKWKVAAASASDWENAILTRLPGARKLIAASERWSYAPDGGRIACVVEGPSGNCDVKIFTIGTGTAKLLVEDAHNPAWSPGDGRWIAFERQKGFLSEVWLVEAKGARPRDSAMASYRRGRPTRPRFIATL